ncbi:RNase HI [Shewanella sp. phage 1/4]|uniref:Rnase H n=1 Tax=Shewanella phage 1/4 TaxID=1458859 RepID=UPI0004F864E2|nr:Rnase H [Shewanella sp. phage 1/4]AHK11298.1 RNase HI [Shewanella sp. phage 1/4]
MKKVDCWTDGSALKAEDGKFHCGAGTVLIFNGKERHISTPLPDATVNIAELTAVVVGLEALKEPCDVTVYSDSQYTIDCITKWYIGWSKKKWKTQAGGDVKNKHLIQHLHSLCQQHNVKWVKVKSHSDLYYNDLADQLAVQASNLVKSGGC